MVIARHAQSMNWRREPPICNVALCYLLYMFVYVHIYDI